MLSTGHGVAAAALPAGSAPGGQRSAGAMLIPFGELRERGGGDSVAGGEHR